MSNILASGVAVKFNSFLVRAYGGWLGKLPRPAFAVQTAVFVGLLQNAKNSTTIFVTPPKSFVTIAISQNNFITILNQFVTFPSHTSGTPPPLSTLG